MRKKRKNLWLFLCLFLISMVGITFFENQWYIHAASASITFSTDSKDVTLDTIFTVTLTIEADANLGEFEAFIIYDSSMLQYQKDSDKRVNGGEGLLKISDMEPSRTGRKRVYTMQFSADSIGACEIYIQNKPSVFENDGGKEMSVSSNRLSINVIPAEETSTNANLKSLRISPGTLEQEFDPELTQYNAIIKSDVKDLIVSAIPEDPKSEVTVSGNENLVSGENVITIRVKAESSAIKEYKIVVTKEWSNSNSQEIGKEEDEQEEGKEEQLKQDTFSIIEQEDRIQMKGKFDFEILPIPAGVKIPAGYQKSSIILYGITIPAYTSKKNMDTDRVLIYGNIDGETPGIYQFDQKEKTIQRYIDSENMEEEKKETEGNEKKEEEKQSKSSLLFITIILAFFLFCSVIGNIIVLSVRRKKK